MGYYMDMREACFEISNENKETALELLKAFIRTEPNLSWIDNDTILRSKSLEEAMSECQYDIEEDDETGDVTNIYFSGEKLGDDALVFDAIAPAVKEGSYIEMSGEDGTLWRWVIKDGKCIEIVPEIKWDE